VGEEVGRKPQKRAEREMEKVQSTGSPLSSSKSFGRRRRKNAGPVSVKQEGLEEGGRFQKKGWITDPIAEGGMT